MKVPSGEVKFFQWPARKLEQVWPMIKPYVKGLVERLTPKLDAEDLITNIVGGKWQLWLAWVPEDRQVIALMITELEQYKNGEKSCHMVIATGDHREQWQDLALKEIEKWALAEGCTYLSGWCRPGWESVTRQHGYKRTHVMIEKKLVQKAVKPSMREEENGRRESTQQPDSHAED